MGTETGMKMKMECNEQATITKQITYAHKCWGESSLCLRLLVILYGDSNNNNNNNRVNKSNTFSD